MSLRSAHLLAAVAWLLSLSPAWAGYPTEPRQWLDRMSTAMSQMTYQGTFVYMLGEQVQTLRITHVAGEQGVRERLVSLSGPSLELVRDANGVRWFQADDKAVVEDNAYNRSFFPDLPLDQQEQPGSSYALKFGRGTRVAGQETVNIKVIPRDNYRYGYSLWLEKHSGLLLKWELIDSDRKPLARLMFTDVRMGSEVDSKELKPSGQLQKLHKVGSVLPAGRSSAIGQPSWQPERLPPGFMLTKHRTWGGEAGQEPFYEHLVFSDGLAAVSVYVETLQSDVVHPEIVNRHGTTHAFTRQVEDVAITVVGEVPALTVEVIGKSVQRADH